ncbi:hypothetical protein QBC41DRAFT_391094 [Cercophora samala]|uniref:Uncharacterized protein n=1 Tax=Cercophora samala TaxID=330535 RepID=A0AA40DE97_9PEZI|nr:hypothetical protein QBC41DRAFT_391094 [Cercophora samala]
MLQSSIDSPRRGEHGEYKNVGKACMVGRVVGRIGFLGGSRCGRGGALLGVGAGAMGCRPCLAGPGDQHAGPITCAPSSPLVELFPPPPTSTLPPTHPPTAVQLFPQTTAANSTCSASNHRTAPRLAHTIKRYISQEQLSRGTIFIRHIPSTFDLHVRRRAPLLGTRTTPAPPANPDLSTQPATDRDPRPHNTASSASQRVPITHLTAS